MPVVPEDPAAEDAVRADAIFRLIITIFFLSLPLLLAIKRSRREAYRRQHAARGLQEQARSPEDDPRKQDRDRKRQRRSRRPSFLRRIAEGIESAWEEDSDRDLQEHPELRRRRTSQGPSQTARPARGASERYGKVRVATPMSGKEQSGYKPLKPASGGMYHPPRDSAVRHAEAMRRAEEALFRVERLPALQRAIAYHEIFGPPRGLEPNDPERF